MAYRVSRGLALLIRARMAALRAAAAVRRALGPNVSALGAHESEDA
jgi:hypothetical protein